ncbi:LOW QUALITY PROTEIN: ubiquitin carboxyl-terminal hydrolase CYLD [Embiotoca jacksoni]|uniref:LOW QUALITY PROTEIN: ubiquitin carboxyl-terminal hydrolase CYLD n=1 Tax=Embiotoca jacksoni TaxID=100190 RepID=UPI0037044D16
MTSSSFMYYIITEKPDYCPVNPGCICYSKDRLKLSKLKVVPLSSRPLVDYDVDVRCMTEVSLDEAGLLQALPEDAERLKWFHQREALRRARRLSVGATVSVEEEGKELRGVVRYVGWMARPTPPCPVAGVFFGIELKGADRRKGNTDGTFKRETLFSCQRNCGVFAPFTRVSPPSTPTPPPQPHTDELTVGDRVTYFSDSKCRYGMVVSMDERDGQHFVWISTDKDEAGKSGGEIQVPLDLVAKGEVPAESESIEVGAAAMETDVDGPCLGVNSMVEVTMGASISYGIIRWIGNLPDRDDVMVGLELEEEKGASDGVFMGERLFSCPFKRALFIKLSSCRPDSRFQSLSANRDEKLDDGERDTERQPGKLETVPPITTGQVSNLLIGRMKGIQGHCNSCYMDAALFGLFSCSSVLDSVLFKSTTPQDAPIQETLLLDIVNPLRSQGFVEGRHIMKLRQQLQKHGYSRSFTTDEKDPEEFLMVIMYHILALDPLLKLSAAGKVQESYCYQIFLDQNHSLVLPTVQQLLEHSFHSAGLKLAEVPSCLILQMPRFGKKFKMFDKIIPSLELDITDLLSEGPQQCMLCGHLAVNECTDCFKDPVFSHTGFKVFCAECSAQVHCHPQRQSHRPARLDIPVGYVGHGAPHALTRDKLELFAVLCIETSHYVSFVKHGPDHEDWIFFDSMADRQGERDGFNIPEVQACPEVAMYLEMSPAELANQVPRDMKGVAKRLFCDAYMYLYQSTSMCLYR